MLSATKKTKRSDRKWQYFVRMVRKGLFEDVTLELGLGWWQSSSPSPVPTLRMLWAPQITFPLDPTPSCLHASGALVSFCELLLFVDQAPHQHPLGRWTLLPETAVPFYLCARLCHSRPCFFVPRFPPAACDSSLICLCVLDYCTVLGTQNVCGVDLNIKPPEMIIKFCQEPA